MLIGLIPIVVVFEVSVVVDSFVCIVRVGMTLNCARCQGILSFKLSSRYVAPFSTVYSVLLGSLFFRDAEFFADNNTLPAVMGGATLIILDRFFWAIVECTQLRVCVTPALCSFGGVSTRVPAPAVLCICGCVVSRRRFQRVCCVLLHACSGTLGSRRKHAHGVLKARQNANAKGSRGWYVFLVCEAYSLSPLTSCACHPPAFSFAILLAVVAPGGSNYIVAGAILIEMNPSNLFGKARLEANFRIGTICLFGNALISAFNLLGIWYVRGRISLSYSLV